MTSLTGLKRHRSLVGVVIYKHKLARKRILLNLRLLVLWHDTTIWAPSGLYPLIDSIDHHLVELAAYGLRKCPECNPGQRVVEESGERAKERPCFSICWLDFSFKHWAVLSPREFHHWIITIPLLFGKLLMVARSYKHAGLADLKWIGAIPPIYEIISFAKWWWRWTGPCTLTYRTHGTGTRHRDHCWIDCSMVMVMSPVSIGHNLRSSFHHIILEWFLLVFEFSDTNTRTL